MEELTPLERAALEKLFEGDQQVMVALREQVKRATVAERTWYGTAGFVTDLAVPEGLRLEGNPHYDIADVNAAIEGMRHGALFHVHVRDGLATHLEADSFDEEWPEPVERFELSFFDDHRRLDVPGFDPPPPPVDTPWSRNPFPGARVTWTMSIEHDGVVVKRRVTPGGVWVASKLLAGPRLLIGAVAHMLPADSRVARAAGNLSTRWSTKVERGTSSTEYLVRLRSEGAQPDDATSSGQGRPRSS